MADSHEQKPGLETGQLGEGFAGRIKYRRFFSPKPSGKADVYRQAMERKVNKKKGEPKDSPLCNSLFFPTLHLLLSYRLRYTILPSLFWRWYAR